MLSLTHGYAANGGDFLGYLGARQDAAFAGLRALGHLDLEHADLFVSGDFPQLC